MILGIDPGLRGALALFDPDTCSIVRSSSIATNTVFRNGKRRLTLDIPMLVRQIREYATPGVIGVLERVAAYRISGRRQGGSSMFSFGKTAGAIEAALAASGISYSLVMPAIWKKALGCPADKDGTLVIAGQLMPASVEHWTPRRKVRTKADCEGIGEAALLAYYGARQIRA